VAIADMDRLKALTKAVGIEARSVREMTQRMKGLNERLAADGASARPYACTEACPSPCNVY
jgi:hypothetical protein